MIGVHKSLEPVLVSIYEDNFELIVVDVKVLEGELRLITGCGPQECWPEGDRLPFFLSLEAELVRADMEGKEVIIGMDANSKLGSKVIAGDPHPQSQNGQWSLLE